MRQEQEEAPRGSLVPRTLLTDPLMVGYQAPGGGSGGYGAVAPYRPPPYAARKEDIPATLYSLGQVGRLVTRGMSTVGMVGVGMMMTVVVVMTMVVMMMVVVVVMMTMVLMVVVMMTVVMTVVVVMMTTVVVVGMGMMMTMVMKAVMTVVMMTMVVVVMMMMTIVVMMTMVVVMMMTVVVVRMGMMMTMVITVVVMTMVVVMMTMVVVVMMRMVMMRIDWLMITYIALFSALLSRLTALAYGSTCVTSFLIARFLNIHRSGVLTALAWLVPHETAAVSAQVLCTPYNHAPCHFMQSHIRKVYACLAVTCHLHFWQNERDLLRATAVTRGWNGYRN